MIFIILPVLKPLGLQVTLFFSSCSLFVEKPKVFFQHSGVRGECSATERAPTIV